MRLIVILLVIACNPAAVQAAAELDAFDLHDPSAWSCARRIGIRPFTLVGKFKGKRSPDEYMRQFAAELSAAMSGQASIDKIFLVEGGQPNDADAIIEGKWLRLNTGSRAKRFWVGFGAGTSWCSVELSAVSVGGSRPLFHIVHERGSAMGLAADELGQDVSAVAADIAEVLLGARGDCRPELVGMPPAQPGPSQADLVQVAIDSQPAGAEVLLDGFFIGTAPLPEYRIPAGEHQLEIRKAGYVSWVRTIRIVSGSPTRVDAVLEREPPNP